MTQFRRLALATTVTTLAVIGVGALVRATNSGDGCPDWPRCFGRWIPPLEYHALIEYSHRSIGAVAIVLLCATAVVALRRHRSDLRLLVPVLVATSMIFMQAALGAIVVAVKTNPRLIHLEPTLVTFHIATAMILIGLLVMVTVRAFRPDESTVTDPGLARLVRAAAASVFGLIVIGAYVRGNHAGLVFPDWPLMNGGLLPDLTGPAGIYFLHRLAALVVGILVMVTVVRARRSPDPAVRIGATVAGVLFAAQIVVGGVQVWTRLAATPVVAHVVLSASIWAALVATTALVRLPARAAHRSRAAIGPVAPVSGGQTAITTASRGPIHAQPGLRAVLSAYLALTKPRIIVLLLVTTVPSMMLAARGLPSVWLIAMTLAGGTLAAASANTFNCYVDRDIDAVMRRTRDRPLPAHRVTPAKALWFGVALAALSLGLMVATVNLPAALLAQAAIAFYVFVYTIGLKRSTPQNIVIGGAAGAVPCLVGWAAVTGTLGLGALVLFAIVFLWTPPHFWALAMRFRDDYASAGIPMMPVVAGPEATRRKIVAYTAATVGMSLALWPLGDTGWLYPIVAAGLGAWFLRAAIRPIGDDRPAAAMALFHVSIWYLAWLFAAVGVDAVLVA